jgi:toxin ParE1/3/4
VNWRRPNAGDLVAEAVEDLAAVRRYIKQYDAQAATQVAERIRAAVARLGKAPGMGRPGRVTGTRELLFPRTPYILPYRVVGERLEIIAVFHSSRKWPEEF